jgi:hypothetical protein
MPQLAKSWAIKIGPAQQMTAQILALAFANNSLLDHFF